MVEIRIFNRWEAKNEDEKTHINTINDPTKTHISEEMENQLNLNKISKHELVATDCNELFSQKSQNNKRNKGINVNMNEYLNWQINIYSLMA